jgi:hypothetical protein
MIIISVDVWACVLLQLGLEAYQTAAGSCQSSTDGCRNKPPSHLVVVGMWLPTLLQGQHSRSSRAALLTMLLLLCRPLHVCRLCGDWHVAANHVSGAALPWPAGSHLHHACCVLLPLLSLHMPAGCAVIGMSCQPTMFQA